MHINLLEYLEHSAAIYPNKTAFIDETCSVTFAQLMEQAKAIGSCIFSALNGEIGRPVVVFTNQTVSNIITFLGVLYSGNCYVPLDSELPAKRMEFIMQTLQPIAAIYPPNCKVDLDSLGYLKIPFPQAAQQPVDENALQTIRKRMIDTDPAYIIFTSGSTGAPKGIVISHKSVIDLAEWLVDTFNFSETDILGSQTPFYFDASVKDLYITLKCGATANILPKKLFSFPIKLIEYLNHHKINVILWATSALTLVANSKVLLREVPVHLTKVFFAGEAMYAKNLNTWRAALPNCMYVNLYGPTEITVDCTYYIVNRDFADTEQIPIGNACRNMEVMLLNEDNLPVKEGETGEICVRGTGVSFGYYNDEEKTNAVFVQNPLNKYYRETIYRTGDIARYNEYGEIVFLARKDGQIKHMGNRIELGDIETAVNSLDLIVSGICFYDKAHGKIVLIYQGDNSADNKYIISGIKDLMPKYMFPNVIIKVNQLPYNANSKIDRKKLEENYFNGMYN